MTRIQNWNTNCWLNSAHSQSFPNVSGVTLHELPSDFNREISETKKQFKHDRTTTVVALERDEERYVLKRYNARSTWHQVKRALRLSRAQRCWCMSFHFQRAGLNVAEPVIMLESREGPVHKDAYLVTKFLEGEELLSKLPKMEHRERHKVRRAIEGAFELMYTHRITHGDMKASNLLWVNERLFFIDLDAAKKHRSRLSWRHSNKKDRKRF